MKLLTCCFIAMAFTLIGHGQIISQFTWDTNPVTVADVGPNATSISSSAISDANGVGGTNGLNAGLPKQDIDMVIHGGPEFDVDGIDISLDYQREESFGTFVMRGSSLNIKGCSDFAVTYRVEDGFGGFTTVSSGDVYSIPNDDVFRTYRFYYLPSSGLGVLTVDGAVVWSNDGPDNRNMYWVGAGDIIVGDGMDGTGNNKTFLDNLIIGSVFDTALPIELISFETEPVNGEEVKCSWATASEINNDFFTVEKSLDGQNWTTVGTVNGAGNSSAKLSYDYTDEAPYSGTSYYRLKQTDFDGTFTYSETQSVTIAKSISLYPNPAKTILNIGIEDGENLSIRFLSITGQEVYPNQQRAVFGNNLSYDISILPPGVYFVMVGGQKSKFIVAR